MTSTHVTKAFTPHSGTNKSSPHLNQQKHVIQTQLWSTLKDVFDLLRMPSNIQGIGKDLRFQHVHFRTGQRVHIIGQELEWLFVVNSGFLKTASIDEFGNEQIVGFPMKGDLLGGDSICTRRYPSESVALSDCNLILLPFQKLIALGHENIEIQNAILNILSRELQHTQTMVSMLGKPNAETKVARFLVYLAERYGALGYSKSMFNLQMTRQEIGSYLGLSLETVSRALSALNEAGLVKVDQRSIWIIEHDILKIMHRIPSSRNHNRDVEKKIPDFIGDWKATSSKSIATFPIR
jgi:CRP/FNR family transcriptional regulator